MKTGFMAPVVVIFVILFTCLPSFAVVPERPNQARRLETTSVSVSPDAKALSALRPTKEDLVGTDMLDMGFLRRVEWLGFLQGAFSPGSTTPALLRLPSQNAIHP